MNGFCRSVNPILKFLTNYRLKIRQVIIEPPSNHLIIDRHNLESLQGMRGFLSLVVVLFHLNPFYWHTQALQHGYLAVDFFFILSGFILGREYGDRLVSHHYHLFEIILRRIARLYPLYIAAALLKMGAIQFFNMPDDCVGTRSSLEFVLLQVFGHAHCAFSKAGWSISVELVINIGFFAVLYYWGNIHKWLLIAMILVSLCALRATSVSMDLSFFERYSFNVPLVRGLMSFCLGLLLLEYVPRLPDLSARRLHWKECIIIALIAILAYPRISILKDTDYLVVLLLFPALLLLALYEKGWICRFFSLSPWQTMGEISYSIYLLHLPLLFIYQHIPLTSMIYPPFQGIVYLGLMVMTASLSYRYIEKPCREAGKKLSLRLKSVIY